MDVYNSLLQGDLEEEVMEIPDGFKKERSHKETNARLTSTEVDKAEKVAGDIVINNITSYQRLIGKLMYAIITRSNISNVVQTLGQFIQQPKNSHLEDTNIVIGLRAQIQEGKLTPIEFEKHAGRETCRKWKNNIWIFIDGNKVPLVSTVLLKYHNQSSKHAYGTHRFCHRDEFIICTECKKERRFCRHSAEECKSYHDALLNANWKCADIPFGKFSCDDKEERKSRRVYRGCLRSSTCEGCSSCNKDRGGKGQRELQELTLSPDDQHGMISTQWRQLELRSAPKRYRSLV
ncbi:Protein ULTRAPETALA 1 [Capsicum chinense]|nr:Protein ULTRAPETALA 1 [Capsicum chinense]